MRCGLKFKLKHIATVQMGYSFRTRLEASADGEIAVIQMKDLQEDNIVNCKELTKIELDEVKEHHLVQKDDLVFRSRGHLTTSAILLENPGKAVVAAPLLRIRVTMQDKVVPEYLNWFINQQEAQIFLTSRAKGTVQQMISKQAIEDLEVILPGLDAQKDIVKLSRLSAHEQVLLRILAKKREQYVSAILMHIAKGTH
jgi:restriction endonuclease S subunit